MCLREGGHGQEQPEGQILSEIAFWWWVNKQVYHMWIWIQGWFTEKQSLPRHPALLELQSLSFWSPESELKESGTMH